MTCLNCGRFMMQVHVDTEGNVTARQVCETC